MLMLKKGMRLFTIMIVFVFFFFEHHCLFCFRQWNDIVIAANREDRENILSLILSPFSFSFPFQ